MRRKPTLGGVAFWLIALVAAVLVALAASSHFATEPPNQAPATAAPSVIPLPASPTSTATTTSSSPTPSRAAPVVIEQAMPVEVYIPALNVRRVVDDKPCPLVDGKIDPDRSDFMKTCVVQGSNLAAELPGTSSPNTTMIVGHTWRAKPTWNDSLNYAAFNALYSWETNKYTLKKGDEVWVRTTKSGKRWLVYTVTGFNQPSKTINNDDLWGHADTPVPNSLKLVGCQQPSDYKVRSSNNIVVQAIFSRVQS